MGTFRPGAARSRRRRFAVSARILPQVDTIDNRAAPEQPVPPSRPRLVAVPGVLALLVLLAGHARRDLARRHRVDGDPVLGQLERHDLREPAEPVLRGRVGAAALERDVLVDGLVVADASIMPTIPAVPPNMTVIMTVEGLRCGGTCWPSARRNTIARASGESYTIAVAGRLVAYLSDDIHWTRSIPGPGLDSFVFMATAAPEPDHQAEIPGTGVQLTREPAGADPERSGTDPCTGGTTVRRYDRRVGRIETDLLIKGERVAGQGPSLDVENPFTEEPVATVGSASGEQLDAGLADPQLLEQVVHGQLRIAVREVRRYVLEGRARASRVGRLVDHVRPPVGGRLPQPLDDHADGGRPAQREAVRGKPENNNRVEYSFELDGPHDDPNSIIRLVPRVRNAPLSLLVAEYMILANQLWGGLLAEHNVPGIYRSQQFMRTRMSTTPGPHESIGVPQYIWSTSPLRRYVDLINQGQILAAAEHGISARLAAPFQPKDADLYAIIGAFESQYTQWSDYQSSLERFWCLRWLQQNDIKQVQASFIKEDLVRLTNAPLVLHVPGLPALERGQDRHPELLGALADVAEEPLDLLPLRLAALGHESVLGQRGERLVQVDVALARILLGGDANPPTVD